MLFTPLKIGPLTLRNRSIRAAAFEGMCPGHTVSERLVNYHRSVAAGGVGMTTVAYAAVIKSGLSFPHQLWLRKEIIPGLKTLTDAIHQENAAVSVQIGHCGNMSKHGIIGSRPVSASSRINLYAPSYPRAMNQNEIAEMAKSFGQAVRIAQQSGFDAVEVHAGHGYLISQFLSPYTNHRRDEFGGPLKNRMRFLEMVMQEVMEAAADRTAVLVKMNMRDGFSGGMEVQETLEVAGRLEKLGAHALVLSGGFVSRAPMYILRGAMPVNTLALHIDSMVMSFLTKYFGRFMVRPVPFTENYFMEDAKLFRRELKMPLVYVGGILSRENIEEALSAGFDAVAIARALIKDPDFINKLKAEELKHSSCDTCNYCIAVMYNEHIRCIQNERAG